MSNRFFITGATGGLGKAFAVECARRGYDLFLSDLDQNKLTMLSEGLHKTYQVHVVTYICDLTDFNSREKLFNEIRREQYSFRGLINVAGCDYEGLFQKNTRDQNRTIVRLNIEAVLELSHFLLNHTCTSLPFHIVNVASLAAFFPMPFKATYAASKRFLLNYSLALREELRDQNTTVTVLCPAGLPTTQSCINAINAQGILGQITTRNIGKVACRTIDLALKGRGIYIPGFINQILMFLGVLLPSNLRTALINKRWRAAHAMRVHTNAEHVN